MGRDDLILRLLFSKPGAKKNAKEEQKKAIFSRIYEIEQIQAKLH